jgi:hypothetical protein
MIKINDNDYRLVLLDTNALSEFAKHDESFRRFVTWSITPPQPMFVPCFSAFSLLELRRYPDVYGRFSQLFRELPCMLVKSHEELLDDEVRCYPDPSDINPTSVGFSTQGGKGTDLDRVLEMASADETVLRQEKYWNDAAHDIVEGIASLVPNFPPDRDTYTRVEVQRFLEITVFSQIAMRHHDFAEQMVTRANQPVNISAFPSVKATAYAVWHKFYADLNRKRARSDAFDIIIVSAVPYVDAIITERHLAQGLRQAKRMDNFIEHLTIQTLPDFRHSAPPIHAPLASIRAAPPLTTRHR